MNYSIKSYKPYTIHTSRTIMFKELSDLISQGLFDENNIIEQNPIYKTTKSNLQKTVGFLSKIYDFQENNLLWKVFVHLMNQSSESDKRLMTLFYALLKDDFLKLSIPVVIDTKFGNKVLVQNIQKVLEVKYPDSYSPNTLLSTAQNIASSWKQAGYILGKIKNIRVPIHPEVNSVVFAMYLGYYAGNVGDDLFNTKWTKLLELSESKIRELLTKAAFNELIEYNFSGGVTILKFDKLINVANQ